MKTQQFIKEHRFKKFDNNKYFMYHPEQDHVFIVFDGDAMINEIHCLHPTPEETLTIQNLIITYLDDLYMSEFEEIKSMM